MTIGQTLNVRVIRSHYISTIQVTTAKGVAAKTDQEGSADQSMTSYIILVHIFVLILIQVSEQSAITTPQQK